MKEIEELGDYQQLIEFINEIPGGVGIYNIHNNGSVQMVYLNDGYYNIIAATREQREQYMGYSVVEAVPDKYRDRIKAAVSETLSGKDNFQVRIPNYSTDGKERWLQLNGKVVKRLADKCIAYVTYTDVTEFEKSSQALARANTEIQIAATKGGILYWVYDVEKKQTVITNGKGYGYDKVIDNVPEIFRGTGDIHPDEEKDYFKLFEDMENDIDFCECTARIYNHLIDEYQWQHVMFTRFSKGQYIGSSIEITEQKRTEQRFEDEIALRNDLLNDCILFFQINLTKNTVEEKITKCPEFMDNNAPFAMRDEYWDEDNDILPDKEIYGKLKEAFSAEALLNAWNQGKTFISIAPYQMKLTNGIRMVETTASLMKKPTSNEIIAFSYTRDVTDREVHSLISGKLLNEQYESICIVDCRTQKYAMYSFVYDESKINATYSSPYSEGMELFAKDYIVDDERIYYKQMAQLSVIRKELDEKRKYSFSFHMKSDDKEKPVKKMTYFYLDNRHYAILCVLEDVTEVTRKEKENIERLHSALEKAELATKAKSEFLSRMSHDMRTPMNGILGMAELSENENDPQILKANIQKIKDSGDYLLGLINDTLDFQRIESGKLVLEPEIINAASVMRGILDIIKPAAEKKKIDFRFNNVNADFGWYVRVDPLRMKQIFVNLLSNAVKFTPEGGTIEFKSELLKREGMISHDKVTIRDTGIGMSEDFIKNKLFKPFSQEHNEVTGQYAGSGLGLSIVKSLVELMGGSIEVESELGAGTTFYIYMDLERIDVDKAKQAEKINESSKKESFEELRGKKILLAEDHPLNAEIARKLLEKVGCEITWAGNGQECVDKFLQSDINYYNLILMDIRMPVMDGLEAAKTIRNADRIDAKTIPVIAMTANAFAEDIQTAFDAGMNAHIPKPINPSVMYSTIAKYIR